MVEMVTDWQKRFQFIGNAEIRNSKIFLLILGFRLRS
jgi:hypothetical protein